MTAEAHHDGGGSGGIFSSTPTFSNVWTPGLLTHLRKHTETLLQKKNTHRII